MCDAGLLWSFTSKDAASALGRRNAFLSSLDRHAGWEVDHYAAKIIFTELVTNVMRHAAGPVYIALECDGEQVSLTVGDRGPGFAYRPSLPSDILSEGGRGLFLVSKVAESVRIEHAAHSGTNLTAVLPRKASPISG
ncbi:MAG: ATP-binding protein [Candidatus Eremiobacteraeota bacterium]|nr:ATP-binding protein [Candidatus Eremiobacteraeota bacterium]